MLSRQGSTSSAMSEAHSHPQKIGPWRLGRTLGRGATGRVLMGVHHQTGQKAAVKVVSKQDLSEEQGGLPYGIEREIIIMKLLDHRNVLRLYDVWETSKALYLVLEYVEGGELFDLLVERGPLDEQEAVKYFRQIVLGTAYCHALGICHRDLKPENLLLDGSLNVRLADFGMAALESSGRLLETSCGSPHYAAPEIVSGLKYHGAASDVWSCGVILFALLTGRLPFDDDNIRNLLLKVQAGSFAMPQDLSAEAQDLIARMLVVDPQERLTTTEVLRHELLSKYPCPNEDLISVRALPHPETAHKSLGSVANIDPQILSNLSVLWNQRPEQEIVEALLAEGPGPEKTFYALLLRYLHTQDDAVLDSAVPASPRKNLPRSTSGSSHKTISTPRKSRTSRMSASSSRKRPVSFQRRHGGRGPVTSVTNSPFKSPLRSPRKSRQNPPNSQAPRVPLPRNIYKEIVGAAPYSESQLSMPPTLPSKDSIYAWAEPKTSVGTLAAAPTFTPKAKKRTSLVKRSGSKASRRKSNRQSMTMTTGMKRNSITFKLLSTYAKLASENDWEYMDKQTKRTSATFGALCDKIFNHEEYDEDDEKLIDNEERKSREYEKLMEYERKKHEAELKARKELAKQKRRQKRRSLFSSSNKLHITVTEDIQEEGEDTEQASEILPGKRSLYAQRQAMVNKALRALSEDTNESQTGFSSTGRTANKRRSVTQPISRRQLTPILTRRPVSRLDPLWIAHENKEVTRAQDAFQAEYNDLDKQRKKTNRESMVSFGYSNDILDSREEKHHAQIITNGGDYELAGHKSEDTDLSEDYLSEIIKSRLLNSRSNMNGILNTTQVKQSLGVAANIPEERKTLIGSVNIPQVTRQSKSFSSSNKRLSLISLKSTRESYRDLNSFLDTHTENSNEDENNEELQSTKKMPSLRTSFADRLGRVKSNLPDIGDEDELLDSASVIDFDEHLAKKRFSSFSGEAQSQSDRRKSVISAKGTRGSQKHKRGSAEIPVDADYTFAEDDGDIKDNADEVFESIKLPDSKVLGSKSKEERRVKKSSSSTMLFPTLSTEEHETKPKPPSKNYGILQEGMKNKPNVPLHGNGHSLPSTASKTIPELPPGKRSRSIFRKLSWGNKKLLDEQQSPSPADSRSCSVSDSRGGLFSRLFSSSDHSQTGVRTYQTILPTQEMMSALFALLKSWSNFGVKDLRRDTHGNNILGSISKKNTFNIKSCRFRIQVASREANQKSEVICGHTKGSVATSKLLFQEIQRVLEKEGVIDV